MPDLLSHQSQKATKLLAIGDSGTGKSGALASLAEAGYNLRILDFDNGLDILVNALKASKVAPFSELAARVKFATLTDKLKSVNGILMPDGVPTAFTRAMNLLTHWKTETEDLGPVSSWGEKDILVVDSLTFMSDAAFRFVEVTGGYKDPRQTYGEAQKKVEMCLGLLCSTHVQCNVIVNAHVAYMELPGAGVTKGFPTSIGKALSPQIPRYFNTMLEFRRLGSGTGAKRMISAVPSGLIDLKTPTLPGKIPSELPIETGLADFFKALRAA